MRELILKMNVIGIISCIVCITSFGISQSYVSDSITMYTPEGVLDNYFDNYGNHYFLDDLRIKENHVSFENETPNRATLLCQAGYFDLYFELGSGMEGGSTDELNRRAVICQLFSDISNFIASPISTNSLGTRVNIFVRNILEVEPNAFSMGILGLATSFYNIPANNNSPFGGIVDNEIWKTINSGIDSYTGVTSPLLNTGPTLSGQNHFYHGMVAFNFSTVNWNLVLENIQTFDSNLYDLYSVALHEVVHALGFASLINGNGSSKFNNGSSSYFNYFTRYDLFLKDKNSNNLLTNTGACSSMYDYQFNSILNPPSATLAPGCTTNYITNNTNCSNAIKYVGSNTVKVYTSSCFEGGSSLSHFEDQCYPVGSPYGNDVYFCMSNAGNAGPNYNTSTSNFEMRYLKPEERGVLCDLRYSTSSTFGSSNMANDFTYASACSISNIIGVNDGLAPNGTYAYTYTIGAPPLVINNFLNNDYIASDFTKTFECLQDVFDPTNSSFSSITSTSFSFSATTTGLHLIRYVPKSVAGGLKGNITYIYIYVLNSNCVPSTCKILNNGDFENSICGGIEAPNHPSYHGQIDCWSPYSQSVDIFRRDCNINECIIPTGLTPDIGETWDGALNNMAFIGLGAVSPGVGEAMQTSLNSPLINGVEYTISLRIKNRNNFNTNHSIGIFGVEGILPYSMTNNVPLSFPIEQLKNITLISDNNWHYYQTTFQYNGNQSINNMIVVNTSFTTSTTSYLLIDDISIVQTSELVTISLPDILCQNQIIDDLSLYISQGPPNGTFSGNGVVLTNGLFSFDPTIAGAGIHEINYMYTDNIGCEYIISDVIEVLNSNALPINITASSNNICPFQNISLSVSNAISATWNPGNVSGTIVTVAPSETTLYSVSTIDDNGCPNNTEITITVQDDCNCGTQIGSNGTLNGTYTTGQVYRILNDVLINGTVIFNKSELKIGDNVTITVNGTLKIYGSHLYACRDMWNGIRLGNNATIIIDDYVVNGYPTLSKTSLIEDARIAVDMSFLNNSTSLVIPLAKFNNVTFNRNDIGIKIKNAHNVNFINQFKVNNCVFTSRKIVTNGNATTLVNMWPQTLTNIKQFYSTENGNPHTTQYISEVFYPDMNMKAPLNRKPSFGIYLEDVSSGVSKINISIGNVFDNIVDELYITNSNVSCKGNYFQNTIGSKGPVHAAINGIEVRTNYLQYQNDLLIENNTFVNCHTAINLSHFYNLKIQNNTIKSSQKETDFGAQNPIPNHRGKNGIVLRAAIGRDYNILSNKIYNIENGIQFSGLHYNYPFIFGLLVENIHFENFNINYNTIKRSLSTLQQAAFIRNAIIVNDIDDSFVAGNVTKLKIKYNTITEVNKGITCTNWKQHKIFEIMNNTISLYQGLNPAVTYYGIDFSNQKSGGSFNLIKLNNITGFTNNLGFASKHAGIKIESSDKPLVYCNTLSNTVYGLYFSGLSGETKTSRNTINNNGYGFVLDNNAIIGNQGYPVQTGYPNGEATENSFTNFSGNRRMAATLGGSNATLSKMFVKYGIGQNPNTSSTFLGTATPYLVSNGSIIVVTGDAPLCSAANPDELILQDTRERFKKIIDGEIVFDIHPNETEHIAKKQIYTALLMNPALMENEAVLQAFFTEHDQGNDGKIDRIHRYIGERRLTDAQVETQNIEEINPIDANYKRYFEIYLNYMTDTLTSADSTTLFTISDKCPHLDGAVVFQARALYEALYGASYHFNPICEEANRGGKMETNQLNSNLFVNKELIVYPNPTKDKLTIKYGNIKNCNIKLVDQLGRAVEFSTDFQNDNLLILAHQLSKGFYSLIIEEGKMQFVKKIIVE